MKQKLKTIKQIQQEITNDQQQISKGIIERILCKYWDLRPSEAHRFICEGEEKRKI